MKDKDLADENLAEFNEIAEHEYNPDIEFDRFDDNKWNKFLTHFLNCLLTENDDYDKSKIYYGGSMELDNDEIVNMLMAYEQGKLAYYIEKALNYPMNNNDMEEYLTNLIGKSKYAKAFQKTGLTLELHIKDVNIGDGYSERDIVGLGICRAFSSKSKKLNGFNEKTGKYQYVTYVDETEPEDMKGPNEDD